MKKALTQRGFTLVEVIVAVAIVGILATVVLVTVQGGKDKSYDTQRVSDIEQLKLAIRIYRDVESEYPEGDLDQDALNVLLGDYLGGEVVDPLTSQGASYGYSEVSTNCDDHTILYTTHMQQESKSNWDDLCTGEAPGVNSYVVILR
jgi:prepilin-type N-terminal cleavage/methylation domain-containing protein